MKKLPLFGASALLSVMLLSGMAYAKTDASKAPVAPTKPAAEAVAPNADMSPAPQVSEATQKLMRESMEKSQEANKALFEDMKVKHQELQTIIQAPTFDRDAYLEKHEEIQKLGAKLAETRAEAMASVMEKMSPDERKAFGGRGMAMMGRHHGGKGMMKDCPMMKDGKPNEECKMMHDGSGMKQRQMMPQQPAKK